MLDMLGTPFLLLMGPCVVMTMMCVPFSVHVGAMLTVPRLMPAVSMAKHKVWRKVELTHFETLTNTGKQRQIWRQF